MTEKANTVDLAAIDAALRDIHEIESTMIELRETKKDLKQRLPEILMEASKSANSDDKLFVAWLLYWNVTELYPRDIAKQLLNISVPAMRKKFIEHGFPCSFQCCKCKKHIEAEHRQNLSFHRHLAQVHGFKSIESRFEETVMCYECAEKYLERINIKFMQEKSFFEEVQGTQDGKSIDQLKKMPYAKYLESDHWQERRVRHLRSAGFRCQLCNADNTKLHVHHRTYERKGCERFSDLIVLCEECHHIFHERQNLK